MTEQFVLQELSQHRFLRSIYYWSAPGSEAEVDFLFDYNGHVIPVEAKAGLTVHAQSLKQFRLKYAPVLSIKTSLRNLDYRDGVLNLPLPLIWNLPTWLERIFS